MQFEIAYGWEYANPHLPERATSGSAGYDFECIKETEIQPHSIALIPTGIKAKISEKELDAGWYLQLAVRSSTPRKKGLILANGIGIIDADYYENPDNDGHIMFQVYNITDEVVTVEKYERIGQGVFLKYYKTEDDVAQGVRQGGFGSTDMKAFIDSVFGYNP